MHSERMQLSHLRCFFLALSLHPVREMKKKSERERTTFYSLQLVADVFYHSCHVWLMSFFQFQPRDFASSSLLLLSFLLLLSLGLLFSSPHPSLRIIQFITWAAFNSSLVSCETRNYKTLVTVWICVHLSHPQLVWWDYLGLSRDQDATWTEDAQCKLLFVLSRPTWITLHLHRSVMWASECQVFATHST